MRLWRALPGRLTVILPGPTDTPFLFSDQSLISSKYRLPSCHLRSTSPRTVTVSPTQLKLLMRKPLSWWTCPARPMKWRTVFSHMPCKNRLLAYMSGAPVARAWSALWWMALKSRLAPAATTSRYTDSGKTCGSSTSPT